MKPSTEICTRLNKNIFLRLRIYSCHFRLRNILTLPMSMTYAKPASSRLQASSRVLATLTVYSSSLGDLKIAFLTLTITRKSAENWSLLSDDIGRRCKKERASDDFP